jgi:uncharacterized protein (DUF58 family)
MSTAPEPPLPRRAIARSYGDPALRRLELTVLRRLDGLLQGDHAGLVPGPGTDLGDARLYTPGDDVRRIDWALTARTGDPHVRDAIADRELELVIVLDTSGSLAFGTSRVSKRELARDLAGAFVLLGARSGNRVGALLSGEPPTWVPPRCGSAHAARVVTAIARAPVARGDLPVALRRARRLASRRGMIVAVSDFLGPQGWQHELRALAARHDVIEVEVVDRRELQLPDVGYLTLVDAESGARRVVDTQDARVRTRFAEKQQRFRAGLARDLARAGSDHLRVHTDDDWVVALARFAGRRSLRRTAAEAR